MRKWTLAWAVVLLSSAVAGSARGTVPYVITDLGALGGATSYASGINNGGQVAGYAYNSAGAYHAFRTEANQPIDPATDDLGTFGGTCSWAYAINNSGQAVGYAYTSGGACHAFRTEANQPIDPAADDLGTLGGALSVADGINDSGQVVGDAYTSGGAVHAFRTEANQPIDPATDDLGTLGGIYSYAAGINNAGQVVGYAYTGGGAAHAFRTQANQAIDPATDDLGTLGGTESYASAVNNAGQVAGYAYTSNGAVHAFRTEADQSIDPATDDLGTLGGTASYASGVNNAGQVVGSAYTSSGAAHAFLYSASGPMLDLNNSIAPTSGWTLEGATGINDSGQIVGYGVNSSGEQCALLLTSALPGDANLDGRVDINDLTIVLTNYDQSTGMSWETGDFIGDGKVDVNDLTIVLANYGQSLSTSPAGVSAAPEPSSLGLLVLAAIGLAASAWRRRGALPKVTTALAAVFAALSAGVARADVFDMPAGDTSLQTVFVGNAGNGSDPETGYGAVDYNYQMGEFDVTDAQYCQFLNAKLPTISNPVPTPVGPLVFLSSDKYGLYNVNMMTWPIGGGIDYSPAAPTGAKFSVASGCDNWPVQDVSWYDAIRFANWLQNGQGNGSTESGTYTITGGGQDSGTVTVPSAATCASWTTPHWLLPTENEWYKAAYYDPNKPGGAGYWTYPTQSDTAPSNVRDPTGTNNANFSSGSSLTPVGTFAASPGPYGTFDQAGDVWQWNETAFNGGSLCVIEGGDALTWSVSSYSVYSGTSINPTTEDWEYGFRLAYAQRTALPGDANGDGRVDINDLTIVLTNFGKTTGMSWGTGDFIGNGRVDINDLTIVLANYGQSLSTSPAGASAAPEPSGLALLVLAAIGLAASAWRRRGALPKVTTALAVLFAAVSAGVARANVFDMPAGDTSLQTVFVGNAGNRSDPKTGDGAVDYNYQMGEFDVTDAQYCQFLNAKLPTINNPATTTILPGDTYGLYCLYMMTNGGGIDYNPAAATGAKFSVSPGYQNLPVTYVSWYDAVRFVNWLQNGQGNGSTESGTYSITGGGQNSGTVTIPNAATYASWTAPHWVLPTENEWYKAAYYDPNRPGGAGYWTFPTKSNTTPSNVLDPTGTDNANFSSNGLTPVGTLMASPGPYGTFDQGGEIWQWSETAPYAGSSDRLVQGGAWDYWVNDLNSSFCSATLDATTNEYSEFGFRVAYTQRTVLPGDANGDGRVDVNDLTIVLSNFGKTTGMSWGTGDFNGDGKTDINDLTIVLSGYGQSLGSSVAGPAAVPEPSTLALLGVAAAGLLGLGGRRWRAPRRRCEPGLGITASGQ